jgi:hypothetical protein
MSRSPVIAASGLLAVALMAASSAFADEYYIDDVLGDDAADGSEETPWQTLDNLPLIHAGDVVRFKAGGRWETDQELYAVSGATYTVYGDGESPLIRSSGSNVISVYGSDVTISGLRLEGSSNAAVLFWGGGHLLEGCEIADAGMGVMVMGQGSVITRNTFRDLNMVTNDGVYQDYGAEGVMIRGSDTEVSYNRFIDCQADSQYFGEDGGAVEIVAEGGEVVSNIRVHHNYSENSAGFLQAASYSSATVRDAVFAYNVIVDSRWVACLWTGAMHFEGVRFENNTVVWSAGAKSPTLAKLFSGWGQSASSASVDSGAVRFQNNVFVARDAAPELVGTGIDRDHNLFSYPASDQSLDLLSGERRVDDPGFVDLEEGDFHLTQSSPAVDAGADLGYTHDFDDMVVPAGTAPDLGAYEFGSIDADGPPYIPEENPTAVGSASQEKHDGCSLSTRRSAGGAWLVAGLWAALLARRRRTQPLPNPR